MALRNGFTLGKWTVFPLQGRLVSGDEERRVQPKSMDVLLCLVEAAGDVVERDAVLRQVWGERAQSDEPLTRCIGELRRALGDSTSEPEFILTVPKRGYRLLETASEIAAG
ncbi:MAG: transcriptional regulator, partial [Gammaproteobacteria bacterium]|nr:transcriptional regulator [Gammaproteobacteria bacterium]